MTTSTHLYREIIVSHLLQKIVEIVQTLTVAACARGRQSPIIILNVLCQDSIAIRGGEVIGKLVQTLRQEGTVKSRCIVDAIGSEASILWNI